MKFLKILSFINVFALVAYIQVLFIDDIIKKQKYAKTHFPCTYISGMCKVKVTHLNCSGGLPETFCEADLNGRL